MMWPTAEVRWFRVGVIPEAVLAWFTTDFPLLEAQPPRIDVYFPWADCDSVGIKLREGRIEIKQRYGDLGVMRFCAGVEGIPELWRKWALDLAAPGERGANSGGLDTWIPVQKTRLVRNYAFEPDGGRPLAVAGSPSAARGCSMELTQVVVAGEAWWTIGFEATGAESELGSILESVARQALGGCNLLQFGLEDSRGYPRWLSETVL